VTTYAAPALRAARHAIAAARCAAAAPAAKLAWQDLIDWPAWALADEATRGALAARVAAQWYAPALRRCIDGRLLQRAGRLIGEPALQHVMAFTETSERTASASALPAVDALEAAWRDAGRALLLASLSSPALRDAVALHVAQGDGAWPRADHIDTTQAQCLVARALAAPEAPTT